jgi:hypothetical protein
MFWERLRPQIENNPFRPTPDGKKLKIGNNPSK